MDKPQPLTIKGTLYWVERNKLNKFSDKYQIVLGNLSEKAVSALDDMGIAAANKGDEKDYFITMKSRILCALQMIRVLSTTPML